ncbi:uncharacterized protein C8A04DRAFT_13255 [Dichotomopilus funicola]|uniref:F-box domain-containing protein n=1 Tax=Dichotomopilus funicola TaxID=1934379 RepID=A0AAN6V032_9PEZI|nr:hypothetical protein C8A04DRAFT_13255 [Dichotomopilus funicola]
MDFLPVELVRLIFQHCDGPSVKALRETAGRYADVGYEYLIEPHFLAVDWRDDISRLRSIAGHDRLRGAIRSLTFKFGKIDAYNNACNSNTTASIASFDAWHPTASNDDEHGLSSPGSPCSPSSPNSPLQDAWMRYFEIQVATRNLPPLHARSALLAEAFECLPNLRELNINLARSPYDFPLLQDVFDTRGNTTPNPNPSSNNSKRDREQNCKNLNAIIGALRHAPHLESLSIDQLPLEIFRLPDDRRHWLASAPTFASLSRLTLVLDPPNGLLPSARARALNGLAAVLHASANLTHLTIAFRNYHRPREKFHLSFRALFGGGGVEFVYRRLTDLKLEGVTCGEQDLKRFILRHGATLERLRLGGRGAVASGRVTGGVHLHEGSFRGLFTGLRGNMPRLQRFHMEGDAQAGDFMTSSREMYVFSPVTDDQWAPLDLDLDMDEFTISGGRYGGEQREERMTPRIKTVNCLGLERFLVQGGEYPKLGRTLMV